MSRSILRDQILVIYRKLPKRSLSLLLVVYASIFEWFRRTGVTHMLRSWRLMGLL